MRTKNIKVQITLPKQIVEDIDEELKESLISRSTWFLKVAKAELEKKGIRNKKILKLDI